MPFAAVLLLGGALLGGYAWLRSVDRRSAPVALTPLPSRSIVEPPQQAALPPAARRAAPVEPTEVPTSEKTLEIHVFTRAHFVEDGVPEPRVAFEAGVGFDFHSARSALASGITNGFGRAIVRIPWSEVEPTVGLGQRGVAWVRLVDPALSDQIESADFRVDEPRVEIGIWTRAGTPVRGRVVDAQGQPVEAEITVYEATAGRQQAWAAPDFALTMRAAGPWTLLAEAGENGTGMLVVPPARADRPPLGVEIRVTGPGVIRGRILDTSGQPIAALRVRVTAAELGEADRSFAAGGRTDAVVETDAAGAFEARGLFPGLFHVRVVKTDLPLGARNRMDGPHSPAASRLPWNHGPGASTLLTEAPIEADGTTHTFLLRRPHLVVRVVSPSGEPWPGPLSVKGEAFDQLAGWSQGLSLVVLDRGAEGSAARPAGTLTGRGTARFELEGDRTYRVGLIAEGRPWRPLDVPVAADADRITIELVVEPVEPMGTVVVQCVDDSEQLFTGVPRLSVECPETGLTLAQMGFGSSARFEIPTGRWRVVVEDLPRIGPHGSWPREPNAGRFETEIDVVAEREHEVLVRVPAGARLDLTVSGVLEESEEKAPSDLKFHPSPIAALPPDQALPANPETLVSLRLLRPAHAPVSVLFPSEGWGGRYVAPYLALGRQRVSLALPTGHWTLEGILPDGRSARTAVELIEGQTTPAELSFP